MEEEAVKTVTSFEELAKVAVVILKRMTVTGKQIVEICGPMSTGGFGKNQQGKNMRLFEAAIDAASEQGLVVFNQLPYQHAMDRLFDRGSGYCMPILEVFYRTIFESGLISKFLFLPSWYTSRGTKFEVLESIKLSVPRGDFDVSWLPIYWQEQLVDFLKDPMSSVVRVSDAELKAYCSKPHED